jgi:hypothetical protein
MVKSKSKEKSKSAGKIVGIVVAVVIVIMAFVLLNLVNNRNNSGPIGPGYTPKPGGSNPLSAPATVDLSGSVSTTGQGTSITGITFTSSTGSTISGSISGSLYTVTLPNPGTYSISENWQGIYTWQHGSSQNVATYVVDQGIGGNSTLYYNVPPLATPDSQVPISGLAQTGFSTTPDYLEFTASNGQEFQLNINNESYQGEIPNLMNYTVQIFYKNAFSGIQNCTAGTLMVDVGTVVSSTTENWHC